MSAPFDKSWAFDKSYYHHSNPSRPLCVTLYDKCIIRVRINDAWKVLKGDIVGDRKRLKPRSNSIKTIMLICWRVELYRLA
jgi:hypothetical protein